MRAANVQYGPVWRAGARGQQSESAAGRKLYTGPLIIAVFLVIEMLLGTRILFQATSQDPTWWPFALNLELTDALQSPFRDLHQEPALKETGVVDFATLVAFEAYLIAGLSLLLLIQFVHIGAWFVRRGRRNRRPVLTVLEPGMAAVDDTQTAQAA